MPVTFATLKSAINRKLRNFQLWAFYQDEADGDQDVFVLPVGNLVVESGDTDPQLVVKLDGHEQIKASQVTGTGVLISAKSIANPTVLTTTEAHGFQAGDIITITNPGPGAEGGTSILGQHTVLAANLAESAFSIDVNVANSTVTTQPNATENAQVTWDVDTGWITFVTAPAAGSEVTFRYKTQLWDDDDLVDAVNQGVRYFYGKFAKQKLDTSLTPASTTYDYDCPADCDYIYRVEVDDGTSRPKKVTGWETFEGASGKKLRIYSPASSGTLRLYYYPAPGGLVSTPLTIITKTEADPTELTVNEDTHGLHAGDKILITGDVDGTIINGEQTVVASTGDDTFTIDLEVAADDADMSATAYETLESACGVKETIVDALMYYACWVLLQDTVGGKVRDNSFLNAEGSNVVKIWDILRSADNFHQLAELHAERATASPRVRRL